MGDDETLGQELARLIKEYDTGEGSEKAEAWNLIADFAVEHGAKIATALNAMYPSPTPSVS